MVFVYSKFDYDGFPSKFSDHQKTRTHQDQRRTYSNQERGTDQEPQKQHRINPPEGLQVCLMCHVPLCQKMGRPQGTPH